MPRTRRRPRNIFFGVDGRSQHSPWLFIVMCIASTALLIDPKALGRQAQSIQTNTSESMHPRMAATPSGSGRSGARVRGALLNMANRSAGRRIEPGGFATCSRWLRSAATTPPDISEETPCIPAGCQRGGRGWWGRTCLTCRTCLTPPPNFTAAAASPSRGLRATRGS